MDEVDLCFGEGVHGHVSMAVGAPGDGGGRRVSGPKPWGGMYHWKIYRVRVKDLPVGVPVKVELMAYGKEVRIAVNGRVIAASEVDNQGCFCASGRTFIVDAQSLAEGLRFARPKDEPKTKAAAQC